MSSVGSDRLLAAEAMSRHGKTDAAVRVCHEMLSTGEESAHAHALLAHLMLEEGFYDRAVREATAAIEEDPDCVPAYLVLGLAYDRQGGMWDRSILVWEELVERIPRLAVAHVQLGEALAAAGFGQEALDSWQRALEVDPEEARAIYDMAIAGLEREGMAVALPLIRQAAELDESQDRLFFSLLGLQGAPAQDDRPGAGRPDREDLLGATAYALRSDDLFSAAESIRLILDAYPDDTDGLALAAYLYLKQGASNEAMACALRAVALQPASAAALYVLGLNYAGRAGLKRHAARVFSALVDEAPNHCLAHVLMAESCLALQRYSRARAAYERALLLDPASTRARFGLAAACLTEGRHTEAVWHIRRAGCHDVRRKEVFWRLYEGYAQTGGAA